MEERKIIKIGVVGDKGVGKTSIVNQLRNIPYINYKPTIAVNIVRDGNIIYYDFSGDKKYENIYQAYIGMVDYVILVYDVTSKISFLYLFQIIKYIQRFNMMTYFLVGTKIDLNHDIHDLIITDYIVNKFMEKYNVEFWCILNCNDYYTFRSLQARIEDCINLGKNEEEKEKKKDINILYDLFDRNKMFTSGRYKGCRVLFFGKKSKRNHGLITRLIGFGKKKKTRLEFDML